MIEKLVGILGDSKVAFNKPLKECTTFRVGGPAKAVVTVENVDELKKIYELLRDTKEKFFVIGNGSNLLVSDEGFDGVVIKLAGDFLEIKIEGNEVYAGAGCILSKVCTAARDKGLSGLEFAYGIPGTVGGAMVMNAGAYDGEMKFVVESVKLLSEDNEVLVLSNEEMAFGYRDSILKHKQFIVLETKFSLSKGHIEDIQDKMNDFMERRRSKQPLEYPSAGSTFKRPEGNFAGKLIMEAGLAGERVGGASVSTKHCGFVINDKEGTAADIDNLMKKVVKKVKENSGIELEPEVIKIGRF